MLVFPRADREEEITAGMGTPMRIKTMASTMAIRGGERRFFTVADREKARRLLDTGRVSLTP